MVCERVACEGVVCEGVYPHPRGERSGTDCPATMRFLDQPGKLVAAATYLRGQFRLAIIFPTGSFRGNFRFFQLGVFGGTFLFFNSDFLAELFGFFNSDFSAALFIFSTRTFRFFNSDLSAQRLFFNKWLIEEYRIFWPGRRSNSTVRPSTSATGADNTPATGADDTPATPRKHIGVARTHGQPSHAGTKL